MQEQRENIIPVNIEDEMQSSYIDYAMSVIVGRALPDVRDGLKPVQRRIIFSMRELGLTHTRPFSKCAKIVGETMGKYHPHGDAAIYDTLVRMAQDFSLRYPLVDGQGNFGSVDGDAPAAMRYTEARLTAIAEELLRDLDKNTVEFRPNYDGKEMEPEVLPSAIPNLLINGAAGIAVGMATNIPPHNLGEVCDALCAMLEYPKLTLEDILEILPAPDFPTGGIIVGQQGVLDAYRTGRGRITLRGRMRTEQLRGGKEAIIIYELPYQVNKAKLVEEIADLVRGKKIQGIVEVRDESDREGMRVVLELRRGEVPEVVINQICKFTQFQVTFGIILLALVNGRPRYLSLARMMQLFIEHRREVVVRRTQFDLDKAERRLHIVEGLKIAVDNIDEVIAIIRGSRTVETAREKLMKRFDLSSIQAQAILDMRLQRLTGLERQKIEDEIKELKAQIKELRAILASPRKVLEIIEKELTEIKEKYADPRRTDIIAKAEELTIEDIIAEENMVVTISHLGYVKRTGTALYRRQARGGKGVSGMNTKEEDWVEKLYIGTTHDYILIFTNYGRCYWLKVYELPEGGRASRGRPIVNMLPLEKDEKVCAMVPVRDFDEKHYLVFATKKGMVVKNALFHYSRPRKTGINAISIGEGDAIIDVRMTNGQNEIFLATRKGMAVRFHETEVRPTGRGTSGVIGIRLRDEDEVIGMEICHPNRTILSVCEKGYGKRTDIEDYRLIHRGGTGVINIKTTERNGNVVGVMEVVEDDEIMIITEKGQTIRLPVSGVRVVSRNTAGVRLIDLRDSEDIITSIARVSEKEDEGEQAPSSDNAGPGSAPSAPAAKNGAGEEAADDDTASGRGAGVEDTAAGASDVGESRDGRRKGGAGNRRGRTS
ncbi:MAG: DNA gyrase subunit A [Candidatus Sumerlaeia bacterium]